MGKIKHCQDQFQADKNHRIKMIQSVLIILHIDKPFEQMDYTYFTWNLFYLLLLVIETKNIDATFAKKTKTKEYEKK